MIRAFFFAATVAISASASAGTYTIDRWPQDIEKVPCDAWKHNADGSWTQTGTIVSASGTMVGQAFKGTTETRIIETKCGPYP